MKKIIIALIFALLHAGSVSAQEFVPGDLTEDSYSSEWFGFTYSCPESSVMATHEEIMDLIAQGGELVYSENEFGQQILDYSRTAVVYEMLSVDYSSGSTVTVAAEKMPLANMTEEQYLDQSMSNLREAGLDISAGENYKKVEFCNNEWTIAGYLMAYQNLNLSNLLLVRKIDDRMAFIQISCINMDDCNELLRSFKPF